jgi:hypothetical protein
VIRGAAWSSPLSRGFTPFHGKAHDGAMEALRILAVVAIVVAFCAGYVWLDRLGTRWFRALPPHVQERGLLGVLIDRIRKGPSER